MGSSLNMHITGFVGNAPEVRQVGDQRVTSFSVAVSRKNAQGKKLTVWVRINCWQRLAEIAEQYVKKGSLVQVTAEWMRPQGWIDQTGTAQASVDVDAARLVLLDRVEHDEAVNGNGAGEPVSDIPF